MVFASLILATGMVVCSKTKGSWGEDEDGDGWTLAGPSSSAFQQPFCPVAPKFSLHTPLLVEWSRAGLERGDKTGMMEKAVEEMEKEEEEMRALA